MARFRTLRRSYVAALLAVALLSLAGVRSTLMQVERATASSPLDCAMAGMDMGPGHARSHKPDATRKTCPFCDVAGHLPVCSSVSLQQPPSALAWIAWRPRASLGARGPPGCHRAPEDLRELP